MHKDRRALLRDTGQAFVSLAALSVTGVDLVTDPNRSPATIRGGRDQLESSISATAMHWEITTPRDRARTLASMASSAATFSAWGMPTQLREDLTQTRARIEMMLAGALADTGAADAAKAHALRARELAGQISDRVTWAQATVILADLAMLRGPDGHGDSALLASRAAAAAPRSHAAVLAHLSIATAFAAMGRPDDAADEVAAADRTRRTAPRAPLGYALDGIHPAYVGLFGAGSLAVAGQSGPQVDELLDEPMEMFQAARAGGAESAGWMYRASVAMNAGDYDKAESLALTAWVRGMHTDAAWLRGGLHSLAARARRNDVEWKSAEDWAPDNRWT
jgi:hypothetical protein